MTKFEKYKNMPTLGVWDDIGGVEVKELTDEKLTCISLTMCSEELQKCHTLKIHYDTKRPYVVLFNVRLHLDECFRTNSLY